MEHIDIREYLEANPKSQKIRRVSQVISSIDDTSASLAATILMKAEELDIPELRECFVNLHKLHDEICSYQEQLRTLIMDLCHDLERDISPDWEKELIETLPEEKKKEMYDFIKNAIGSMEGEEE